MASLNKPGALLAAALLAWSSNAHAVRLFDIDTFLEMKRVSGITVSPDGKLLAYTQSQRDLKGARSALSFRCQALET